MCQIRAVNAEYKFPSQVYFWGPITACNFHSMQTSELYRIVVKGSLSELFKQKVQMQNFTADI